MFQQTLVLLSASTGEDSGQRTLDTSSLWLFFAPVLSVGVLILFGALVEIFWENGFFSKDRWIPARRSSPQIGYKKANLRVRGAHLQGVIGNDYMANDRASSKVMGFHAYSDFEQALSHPQFGNVLLEVVLSGRFTRKSQGFVADTQRVLQVIPYSCDYKYCSARPDYFSAPSDEDFVVFCCKIHAGQERADNLFRGFMGHFDGEKRPRVRPMRELSDALPWLKENNIVVASHIGKNRFIPTVIEKHEGR